MHSTTYGFDFLFPTLAQEKGNWISKLHFRPNSIGDRRGLGQIG
ncbi:MULTISPECIES: hypothetical protein [unclassified Synechocystis]|nr:MULTISPECIES: hypothetical protein [unclassified Synechocystis]